MKLAAGIRRTKMVPAAHVVLAVCEVATASEQAQRKALLDEFCLSQKQCTALRSKWHHRAIRRRTPDNTDVRRTTNKRTCCSCIAACTLQARLAGIPWE